MIETWFAPLSVCIFILQFAAPAGNIPALYLLAGAGALMLARPNTRQTGASDPLSWLLLAFLLASAVSILLADDMNRALDTSLALFPGALLYLLIRFRFEPRQLRWISWSLTAASISIASTALGVSLLESDADPTYLMSKFPLPYFSVPNDLTFIGLCAPLTLACLLETRSRLLKLVYALSLALCLAAIIVYRSNLALMSLCLGTAIMALWTRDKLIISAVFAVALGALLLDGFLGFPLLDKFLHAEVWGNRVPLWLAAKDMFMDAPMFGHGPGGFSVLFNSYHLQTDLPAWVDPDPRHAPWAHSIYLELLAERGAIGLGLFLACAVTGLHFFRRHTARHSRAEIQATAVASALFALLAAGCFDLSLLRHWVLALLAIMSGTAAMLRAHAR